jgi:hypothetical protein
MSDTDELQIYYDKVPDPATEGKQDDMITAIEGIDTSLRATEETLQASLKQYLFLDTEATGMYLGKAKADGTYLIFKYTDTTARMANISNNPTVLTYEDAWTARESLTYDYIFNLTEL